MCTWPWLVCRSGRLHLSTPPLTRWCCQCHAIVPRCEAWTVANSCTIICITRNISPDHSLQSCVIKITWTCLLAMLQSQEIEQDLEKEAVVLEDDLGKGLTSFGRGFTGKLHCPFSGLILDKRFNCACASWRLWAMHTVCVWHGRFSWLHDLLASSTRLECFY